MMTPEQTESLSYYVNEIAKILYADTDPTTLDSLEAIEITVRQKMLEQVSPRVGIFLPKPAPAPQQAEPGR